ncbi:LPXTG cell wall anchor domain-containing protein [Micromonospora musae]|uniref:LPXTG cell wall anchor domain-containing protein n=1 Tax=Micromonospora musae TaxID=1894970 RepID=A0ABX9RJI5_9ACTN|nr:LPXTG cell wall anchor domain-containing protein [Micromonospora musae]RKN24050.1 LPXTG cell wall anchor domain-containing protein [Micromonospora musae]
MRPFHRSALARAGAVALIVVGGLAAVAAPAHADDQAELALVPLSYDLAKGVKEAKAKPMKFQVANSSAVDAKSVTVKVETAGLKPKKVGFVVPEGCDLTGTAFTCVLGDLRGGTTEDFGIPLFSKGGKGAAGTLTVEVIAANATGDKVEHDLTVTKPGYDLTSWVQDVQANVVVNGAVQDEPNLKPVPRGETVPLDWAVYNDGSRKATGISYVLTVPAGVSFVQKPEGCLEQQVVGKAQLLCEDTGAVLKPGEYYTADVRVKVGEDVTEPVLKEGELFAQGLDAAEGPAAEQPRLATAQQRRTFTEVDLGDNQAIFEAFVELPGQPTPTPTPTPTVTPTGTPTPGATATPSPGGGGGGDGGLPVTGVQVSLIGGIGGAILLAGGALLFAARRRRVVLVAPGDEKSTD